MDFFGSQMVLFLFSSSSKRDAKAIFFEKNVPWHILVSCKVACDNLHLRESAHAHHWHLSAEGTHAQCVHVFYHFKVLIFLVDIHIPVL